MFFLIDLKKPIIILDSIKLTNRQKISFNTVDNPNKSKIYFLIIVSAGNLTIKTKTSEYSIENSIKWILISDPLYLNTFHNKGPVSVHIFKFLIANHIVKLAFPCKKRDSEIYLPQTGFIQNNSDIKKLTNLFYNNYSSNDKDSLLSTYLFSSILLLLTKQYLQGLTENVVWRKPARFEEIVNYIILHIDEQLSVQSLSKIFNITPTYTTYLFNKYEGTSTIKFINSLKISNAENLLLRSNLSVKQISYALGFSNSKYFFKLFKKETGFSPTKFRNLFYKKH